MNTEQLTKLASFAGKSANDFWMSTGKKPADVIAELALSLIEANGKVRALTLENEEMRKIIDAVTDLDNEPQYNEPGMGCGIEDHGYQRDGYLACRYGWHEAMDRIYGEVIPCAEELSFPATGAAVAQIEAQGVEKFAAKCKAESNSCVLVDIASHWALAGEHAEDFAAELREEKQ